MAQVNKQKLAPLFETFVVYCFTRLQQISKLENFWENKTRISFALKTELCAQFTIYNGKIFPVRFMKKRQKYQQKQEKQCWHYSSISYVL